MKCIDCSIGRAANQYGMCIECWRARVSRIELEPEYPLPRRRPLLPRIPAAALRARLAYYGARCWICRTDVVLGENLQYDHVKPLAAGGEHLPANIRPACGPCNLSKGSRWNGERRYRQGARL